MLALADKRPPLDAALMAEQLGVEAVVCLGDLDRAWIEPLARLRLPRLGVHGNHDPPACCARSRWRTSTAAGRRWAG